MRAATATTVAQRPRQQTLAFCPPSVHNLVFILTTRTTLSACLCARAALRWRQEIKDELEIVRNPYNYSNSQERVLDTGLWLFFFIFIYLFIFIFIFFFDGGVWCVGAVFFAVFFVLATPEFPEPKRGRTSFNNRYVITTTIITIIVTIIIIIVVVVVVVVVVVINFFLLQRRTCMFFESTDCSFCRERRQESNDEVTKLVRPLSAFSVPFESLVFQTLAEEDFRIFKRPSFDDSACLSIFHSLSICRANSFFHSPIHSSIHQFIREWSQCIWRCTISWIKQKLRRLFNEERRHLFASLLVVPCFLSEHANAYLNNILCTHIHKHPHTRAHTHTQDHKDIYRLTSII